MSGVPIVVPDLDEPGATAWVGEWLVRSGETVVEGDRLVELVFGDIVVDLPAPVSGTLMPSLRGECPVRAGATLGRILPDAPA